MTTKTKATVTLANPSIDLDVAYVSTGGNTGGGKYFFSFSPDPIVVVEPNVEMTIALTDATDPTITIIDFITSDAMGQVTGYTINKSDARSVTFTNKNSIPYLFQVALIVSDASPKHGQAGIICDPQVINTPDPQ